MAYDLPMTLMGALVDGEAAQACLTAGMIVIVTVDKNEDIDGIVSAHTSVDQAYEAYKHVEMDDRHAIVIPQEGTFAMYYCWLTREELKNACGM